MCVILLALQQNDQYPFILAANRDEYYSRPTASAQIWPGSPEWIGGKDLQAGGTWLAVTKSGKFSAITNHYGSQTEDRRYRSRGELVTNFLLQNVCLDQYSTSLYRNKEQYNGYGLLFGTVFKLRYQSNRRETHIDLSPGVHGLGNHFLNSSWPRVDEGRKQLANVAAGPAEVDSEKLFAILANGRPGKRSQDRMVSLQDVRSVIPSELPLFVQLEKFGTRSSSVILVDRFGKVTFEERTYDPTRYEAVQSQTIEFEIS